jgi:hypothetical protein
MELKPYDFDLRMEQSKLVTRLTSSPPVQERDDNWFGQQPEAPSSSTEIYATGCNLLSWQFDLI